MGEHKTKEKISNKMKWSEKITIIGVILLLTILPLITWDMYYDILFVKYKFFWVTALTMIVLTFLAAAAERKKSSGILLPSGKFELDKPEIAVLVFMAVCGLSTLFSDYKYEAVWGNEGRLCGLFFLGVCGLMYLTVGRKLHFKSWLIDVFLISSMAVCLWGITDFFKMDIFNFKVGLSADDTKIFTSSLGNVNTYTAYVALVCGISSTLFLEARSAKSILWYGGCLVISFFAIIMGQSDNAYLALGALFAFLPYYGFRSKKRIVRYLIVLALLATVIQCVSWICDIFGDKVIEFSGLFDVLADGNRILLAGAALWAVSAAVWFLLRGKGEEWERKTARKLVKIWTVFLIAAAMGVVFLLYDANTSSDPQKYGALSPYLILNDEWGTHRMHNWKIGIQNYREFSPIHKIFGYGPETYGILTVQNNLEEMVGRYNEKYDNAHNEYLQYFCTIGPIGLLAYLSVLFFSIKQVIQKAAGNPYVIGMVIAVICYAVQAAVNIATPLVFPFIWLFLAMGIAAGREK